MARYPLNLPADLKREAEDFAAEQGVSLNQFILWAVAEKIGSLRHELSDLDFKHVTYRRGASGAPVAVVRGSGIRVQTIVTAVYQWNMTPEEVASEYELTPGQVKDALAFYESHRAEIDEAIAVETRIATKHEPAQTTS